MTSLRDKRRTLSLATSQEVHPRWPLNHRPVPVATTSAMIPPASAIVSRRQTSARNETRTQRSVETPQLPRMLPVMWETSRSRTTADCKPRTRPAAAPSHRKRMPLAIRIARCRHRERCPGPLERSRPRRNQTSLNRIGTSDSPGPGVPIKEACRAYREVSHARANGVIHSVGDSGGVERTRVGKPVNRLQSRSPLHHPQSLIVIAVPAARWCAAACVTACPRRRRCLARRETAPTPAYQRT